MADEPTVQTTDTPAPTSTGPSNPTAPADSAGQIPPPADKPAEGSQPPARERDEHGKFKPAEKPAVEGATPPPGTPPDPYAALVLPDGLGTVDEVLVEAKALFAEHKLPADVAQKFVDLQAKVEQSRAAQWARDIETLKHASRTDKEFGGQKWSDTETKLTKVRNLVGPRFNDAMQAYGAGNDPEVIRGLLKLHDAAGLSEDTLVPGARAPTAGMAATLYPNTPQMRD